LELSSEDIDDLKALGREVAERQRAPHEPHCVALAFATPIEGALRFTIQQWIDLEAIRSPLLRGEDFGDPEQLRLAGHIFGLSIDSETVTSDEADACVDAMRAVITDAFAMSLPMKPPGETDTADADGFGDWLLIYSCLVKECGIDPDAALHTEVARAFALIAGVRHNQGWRVAGGMRYALRDIPAMVEEPEAAHE